MLQLFPFLLISDLGCSKCGQPHPQDKSLSSGWLNPGCWLFSLGLWFLYGGQIALPTVWKTKAWTETRRLDTKLNWLFEFQRWKHWRVVFGCWSNQIIEFSLRACIRWSISWIWALLSIRSYCYCYYKYKTDQLLVALFQHHKYHNG